MESRTFPTVQGSLSTVTLGGWPCTINQSTSGSVQTLESGGITVQNGLVQGDKRTPNPFYFYKTVYRAGLGTVTRGEIRNGYCFNPPGWKQNHAVYQRSSGILDSAGTFTINNIFSGTETYKRNLVQPSTRRDYVRDRCLSKIFDEIRTGPNLIVDLAEGGATLRMLKSTLRVRRLMKDFFENMVIPRNLRHATSGQKRLDYMTSKWLEYRYGWTPLISTAYDALDQLNKQIYNKVYTFSARAGVRDTQRQVRVVNYVNNFPYVTSSPNFGVLEETTEAECSWRCETQFLFKLPQGQQIWDWTSLNPASIAWELLPLSFVADWFISIGEYLELLENTQLYAKFFQGGYRTDTFKCQASRIQTYRGAYTGPVYNNTSTVSAETRTMQKPGISFEVKLKDRQKLTSIPYPSYPHVRVKLNAKRQLDAASLLHQLVAKKFR